ncbi:MAG: carbamoyltransferase [Myxococcota bacterium]
MNILGMSSPISFNPAACLYRDGRLVAAVEEERLIRYKQAPHLPPLRAIDFVLEKGGIALEDVDAFAVGHAGPHRSFARVLSEFARGRVPLTKRDVEREILYYLHHFVLWRGTKGRLVADGARLHMIRHHLAHAASAFFLSEFEEANIISLDGRGGFESGILAVGRGNRIEIVDSIPLSSSWGHMYEKITARLGFRPHSDEGKVMGLAAYGEGDVLPFVDWNEPFPRIRHRAFRQFITDLPQRAPGDPLTDEHRNLAASLQVTLERAVLLMNRYLERRTGVRNLCLSGGIAMNCSLNGVLYRGPYTDRIFIQPASSDSGTALGAAAWVQTKLTGRRPEGTFDHAYWGPSYSQEEIESALRKARVKSYERSDDICAVTAQLLADNHVVGWFQGPMELGARALGGRSILANPAGSEMQDRVNREVKWREPWRPFAPSMQAEHADEYLENPCASPFMIHAFLAREDKLEKIRSAVHVDGTCRPHTVERQTHPRYWQLLEEFRKLTGVPVLLNTSFNVKGQPIVNTPLDAIGTFFSCGLEYLAIGDYLVWK